MADSAIDIGSVAGKLYLGRLGNSTNVLDAVGMGIDWRRRQYLLGYSEEGTASQQSYGGFWRRWISPPL